MAKRKRKPGRSKGFKLRLAKNYRSDKYVPYIMNAEIGILQASAIDPDLTDGDVSQALMDLISQLEEPETLSKLLPTEAFDGPKEVDINGHQGPTDFVQSLIMMNLRTAFDQYGPLGAEDVIGILDVIKTSVKRWNIGMHRRGYLTYLEGFLGQMGVTVRELSEEEVEAFGLDVEDFDQPEKGD